MTAIPDLLETPRLLLRPAADVHAEAVLAYCEANQAHLAPWEPLRAASYYTLEATAQRSLAGAPGVRARRLRTGLSEDRRTMGRPCAAGEDQSTRKLIEELARCARRFNDRRKSLRSLRPTGRVCGLGPVR